MIDARELRIGNYIQSKPLSIPRLQISHNGVMTVTGYGISVIESDTNGTMGFEPIPLSEEWLLKFGFELKSEYEFKHFKLKNGFWISMWCKDEPCAGFEEKGVCYWGETYIPVRYVHQLQNLYHVITGGKELEVT